MYANTSGLLTLKKNWYIDICTARNVMARATVQTFTVCLSSTSFQGEPHANQYSFNLQTSIAATVTLHYGISRNRHT